MSVDLYLETLEGKRHPTWHTSAGARDLLKIIGELPTEHRLNNVGGGDVWLGAEPVWRPTNHSAFRLSMLERLDFNHGQWNELCDTLEREPDYWMYFSI